MLFTKAIVRTPAKSVINGIDDYANEGKPDYQLALKEHHDYVATLTKLGVAVNTLKPLEDYQTPASLRTRRWSLMTSP